MPQVESVKFAIKRRGRILLGEELWRRVTGDSVWLGHALDDLVPSAVSRNHVQDNEVRQAQLPLAMDLVGSFGASVAHRIGYWFTFTVWALGLG